MDLLKAQIEYQTARASGLTRDAFNTFSRWQKIVLSIVLIGFIPVTLLTRYGTEYLVYTQNFGATVKAIVPEAVKSEVTLSEVSLIPYDESSVAAYVKIGNESLSVALGETDYIFKLFGAGGENVGISRGKVFLLPGQEKYVIASRVNTSGTAVRGEFELVTPKWQKRINVPKVELSFIQPKAYNQIDPVQFVVETGFTNKSPYHLKSTKTVVVVFDNNKNVIAVTERSEFDVEPSQTRVFKLIWPSSVAKNVASVLVLPDTNVLDSQNLQASNVKNSIQVR